MPKSDAKNLNSSALKNTATSRIAQRLISTYMMRYLGTLTAAIVFMLIAAGMTALAASLMQPVLDDVLYAKKSDMIIPVALAVVFTFTTRGVATYAHTILVNKIGQHVVADIQRDLFNNFLRQDMAFFHANPSGHLVSRVVNDVSVMRAVVSEGLTGLGKNLFTLIFLIGVMFYQDWKLTLFVFCIFPFVSGSVLIIGRKLRKVSKNIQNEMGGLSALLGQAFQGMRLIKAYGMEDKERTRVARGIDRVRDLNIKSVRLGNLSVPINETIVGLIFAGLIIYGGHQVIQGQITPGGLAAFLAAFGLTFEPMKRLAKLNNALQMAFGAAERVFDMMDRQPSILNAAAAEKPAITKPVIRFENVSFRYEASPDLALEGVSFTAAPGEMTALVGASGGGKSTLLNLLMRFYDTETGRITVDGNDLRAIDLHHLRAHMALVSQDIHIFDESVLENIRFGLQSATIQDIEAAAMAAAAHDFIIAMPEGYNTRLGEHGVKLSGGQKQRIAIARAMLRDAPILLLDEATSALDNDSEKMVKQAMQALGQGRTTLVIAHRLSTVQAAQQILVLDQGRIVERGTHDSLLTLGGVYARMYHSGNGL